MEGRTLIFLESIQETGMKIATTVPGKGRCQGRLSLERMWSLVLGVREVKRLAFPSLHLCRKKAGTAVQHGLGWGGRWAAEGRVKGSGARSPMRA